MTCLKSNNLPPLVGTMFEGQRKWSGANWQKTLSEHTNEIEQLLARVQVLDTWSNLFRKCETGRDLIPEIFVDGFMSVHLACMGLYKFANSCLRSELETALRLVYFSTHPVEYEWWSQGNAWYRSGMKKDVWGEGYLYFEQLPYIKDFEKRCIAEKKIIGRIRRIYSSLSEYVHTGHGAFHTKADTFSPKYNTGDYIRWVSYFEDVQQCISIILSLTFIEDLKKARPKEQDTILTIGVNEKYYEQRLKKTIGI